MKNYEGKLYFKCHKFVGFQKQDISLHWVCDSLIWLIVAVEEEKSEDIFKQKRPGKSVSLSCTACDGWTPLPARERMREHRWRADSSKEMETMLWRGVTWSQSFLATPGEDGHLWAHAEKSLLPPLLQSKNFCFPPLSLSLPFFTSTLPFCPCLLRFLAKKSRLIQLMNMDRYPFH